MDIVWMIVYVVIILSILVFIHEGGHYLAARAFKVRVTEFMLGFPGPSIGVTWHGTRFGITCVPLGGYARVCGMEPGEESPHLRRMMAYMAERGQATPAQAAADLALSEDDARLALEELSDWGTLEQPRRKDGELLFLMATHDGAAAGEPAPLYDVEAFYGAERAQQYRSLPVWKRLIILFAGPGMNLLFTILAFIAVYSIIGVDYTDSTGAVAHLTVDPLRAVMAGFTYIGMAFQAIIGLFNPATAAETVSNSTSIMGIAVLSKSAADAGLASFVFFMAAVSVSLGLMNLLPIPPLDGGRIIVELYQVIRRRSITLRALNALSIAGMALFLGFFVFMLNQDIQRFVLGG